MEREFEVQGVKFQLRKIDAMRQFHIVRRLGPILGEILPAAKKLKVDDSGLTEDQKFEQIIDVIQPIMDGLSRLSDKDADYVLLNLLSAAEMHQAATNSWAQIVKGDHYMVNTLDLPTMLQVAGRAFAFNLAGFFSIAPQVSHGRA